LWIFDMTVERADSPADHRPVWTKTFRRKAPSVPPTQEQLRRQGSVLRCAWQSLGESASVVAFLNTHNDRLGGQPLNLALESDDGLSRVEGVLEEIALKA
jgi:hypothetical protein